MWSPWPCDTRIRVGLRRLLERRRDRPDCPRSQGSSRRRLPPGVRSRNVECPSQVMAECDGASNRDCSGSLTARARMEPRQSMPGCEGDPVHWKGMSVEAPLHFVAPASPSPRG